MPYRDEDDEETDELVDLCLAHPAPLPRGPNGDELRVARIPLNSLNEGDFAEYVQRRQPIILTGCVDHWPALYLWTHAYLREKLGARRVHVARTPDGLGDAVTRTHESRKPYFAKPHEATMEFSELLDEIEKPLDGSRAVYYCSHQDSSLTSEFEPLLDDVDASLAWADAAFGRKPSAVNFWLGEDAARTTAHADLYDNLYVVLKGTKEFTLLPPQEGHRLDRARYRAGTYAADLTLELDTPTNFVHWTQIDLESEEAARKLRPVRATVGPGELLFLPALWWHAVSQRGSREEGADCSTVAVNYWYEGFVAMGDEADAAAERAALRLLSEVSGVDLLSGM